MKKELYIGILFFSLTCVSFCGEIKNFEIDPYHSGLIFKIPHLYTQFPGRINSFSGKIQLDPENLSTLNIEAEVDMSSVDTGNEMRDQHILSPDFFNVEQFPVATFKSTSVTDEGQGNLIIKGKMNFRGIDSEMVLKGKFLGYGIDHEGGKRAGFSGEGSFNRMDFGIQFNHVLENGTPILGNLVRIFLEIELKEI